MISFLELIKVHTYLFRFANQARKIGEYTSKDSIFATIDTTDRDPLGTFLQTNKNEITFFNMRILRLMFQQCDLIFNGAKISTLQ